ncbi:MAG: pyruvate, phosphate dikinase [Alphaproteobacteria bacterium]|nr:pyruvate, phosphate dikinase [Alphaproteobacteria bacterium]
MYAFDDPALPPPDARKRILGGKGAGLSSMTAMGLPVPPGFTLTTEACVWFFEHAQAWPDGLAGELQAAVSGLEARTGKTFGDPSDPLLVSVRSGAPVSMPGMMETVLNVGLNDATVVGLAEASGDAWFAWDSYRRLVTMFGDVVREISFAWFGRAQDAFLAGRSLQDLSADEMAALTRRLLQVHEEQGEAFPQDPQVQLKLAIDAVFRSYNSAKARYYRSTQGIPHDTGTAVNVQAMVFGNLGPTSGTGVAFTRNPKTGVAGLFGEWLRNAQGEDVVAGTRTPQPLNDLEAEGGETLQEAMPAAYDELVRIQGILEQHYRDMQDLEFTIERGTLWMLQTRSGKRTGTAAVQIVVDLVSEGVISREEALQRVEPKALEMVLRPIIPEGVERPVIARGLPASPGAATGKVVFTPAEAQEAFERSEPSILVRIETSPEDIQGMTLSQGILTARGGQTSHAAVVARGMGKPCVVGCSDIQVDLSRGLFYAGDTPVRRGDWVTIDGQTGEVMSGKLEMLEPQADGGAMATLLAWADDVASLSVRANADTGPDAAKARQLGALGIGLCRTEHMFFQEEALAAMRRMLIAEDPRSRQLALRDILPIQRGMFADLFRVMDGLPVTIRLLDPPLHEFLPHKDEDVSEVAASLGVQPERLRARVDDLSEANPMMGHRGVRVGITTPEVYATQVRAIFEAAALVSREGVVVLPEVMIPLVALPAELERMRGLVVETAERVLTEHGVTLKYKVGSMIELPRAALLADSVAVHADFFSFGTNDLTQMVFGFSRDDMGKFFPDYQRLGLLPESPLATFDTEGVGQLVKLGSERGRAGNPQIKLGVCGEHGGDPVGIAFFHTLGLDYVSCSPYRVPVARLAAAHAALADRAGA